MDEKENTGTESSAVTAIKVKVVIDTNKTELDKQFNSVKEHYKEKPVKIAFGVNQNDTIRNINDALDKVVKSGKLKTPKVTLDVKIDQSKVTAQLKKAMQSAAKQTVKVDTGNSGSTKTQDTSKSDISRLFSLANRQAKLTADVAALEADGRKSTELETVTKRLKTVNAELTTLKTNLKGVLTESQKLRLKDIEATGTFNASRNTAKGTDSASKVNTRQRKAIDDDLKRKLKQQESIYKNRKKQIQALENYAKNNSNYKNSKIQAYLYGEDGTGNTSGKIKELREQLSLIENIDPSKAVKDFDKNCKALDGTLDSTSQHLKELGFDFRDLKQANVDMTKFKSVYERATKLESSISNKSKYSFLIDSINGIKSAASGCEGDVTELSARLSSLEVEANRCGATTETLSQKLSRLFKEHFQTAVAMYGVAMVKQGLREVYNNVLELDTAVTELKKVSKMTGDEMNEYLDRTAINARELGANISDLVSSTADWKRLGYTDKDSEELARVSALMANVGDQIDNATTASSYLISAMQGFGLVADDAERLLDCMNQIANTEPVSMNDLGIIMQKSSAAMSAAGNTYQETLSLAAAVNGVLQDADTSGTYLKTLSMYLRASKTDAENAGIATDGMADSVSELRSELKQLAGVDIMKDNNTFKSTYQIMKELSEVWKGLSDTTQANITELISGKRGGQSTSALLNNFSVAEDAMKQALNSSGSAMRENQTYMDSLQAKLNQLDSAFQKFSTDLMKSDIPKFFVSLATVFVDGADSAVKFAGALPTLTAAISGVLSVMQMSGKLKNGAGKVNMPSYICCV